MTTTPPTHNVAQAAAADLPLETLLAPIGNGPAAQSSQQLIRSLVDWLKQGAAVRPLVILLDDLHWADSASLNLLFHLSRALMDCRVLIIGTYRPDDVALGRGDERHPLEPILNELKRYGGDIVIDLSEARTHEGRAFVDALIDSEPNQLNEAFRAELFAGRVAIEWFDRIANVGLVLQ